jgi:NADH-quinone oxidoreductase subunit D
MARNLRTQELLVNMGPQHPATHGVLRLVVRTDGEMVSDVTPVIGYLHRCAEKISENVNYTQWVPYTDRLDYLSGMGNNLGISLALEKLLGVEAPERAQAIRVIMAELTRIASHLIAFGVYGMDIGAFTPFLYAWREREDIMDLFDEVCGQRLTTNYIRPGGVAFDIDSKFVEMTREFLRKFEPRIKEYHDLLTYNQIFVTRTKGIGVIPPEQAIAWGLSGPMLRASGVDWDIRKSAPYCGYNKYDFDAVLGDDKFAVVGDNWNRYYVRVEEMVQAARIIRQALDGLPAGDFKDKKLKRIKPKPGEAYVSIENPRGELGFYVVSNGTDKPLRVKCRAPSFVNLSILPELSKQVLIADLVAILGTFDIVLGEVDR